MNMEANNNLGRPSFVEKGYGAVIERAESANNSLDVRHNQHGNLTDIDTETLRAAQAFMEAVAGRYDMIGAILFGSRARKSHRPDSDADVAVLLHGQPGRFVATKLAMDDLAYDVLLHTGIRIQPLPIWEEEWKHPEAYSNPRLLVNIEREGIRL